MLKKAESTIERYQMLREGDKVVAGISGGADSICLLFVLLEWKKRMPIEIKAVHVHHGIRGEEADADERFVEEICRQHEVEFEAFHYDVKKISRERGMSEEETGRMLRYETFEDVCKKWNGTRIAVAHNRNDQAETVLLNLFRGCGLKGISGIPAVRGKVIRPLLECERSEILDFLSERRLDYRQDRTNFLTEYTRNKIRLKFIPYVEREINKGALEHICRAAESALEAEKYIERKTEEKYPDCVRILESAQGKKAVLNAGRLIQTEEILRKRMIRKAIEEVSGQLKDITAFHTEEVLRLLNKETGKQQDLPYHLVARREYETIIIEKKEGKKEERGMCAEISVPGEYVLKDRGMRMKTELLFHEKNINIPEKMYTKWFDCDKIKGNLLIRTRKSGDYIQIDEEGNRMKLKAYFINNKIPRQERDRTLLLADGDHVLWIIGHRISAGYKVTDTTEKILKVQVMEEKKDE